MKNEKMQQQEFPIDNPVRQRIVSAARRHFFAYGFRSVTMDDLARDLGMSKKTLYAHFLSKMTLVEAVLVDKIHDGEVDLRRITSASSFDFAAALHQLLAHVQNHLDEVRPPFVRDLQREAPEIFRIVETRRREMLHRYFGKLIGDGRSAGIIREDVPAQVIVEILLGATQAIMNPEKLTQLGVTPKDGFSAIIAVILEGVITETGRAIL